ncbi:hypothetical protein PVAG01_03801 [Phlyctema vagabunda]|uniref:Uncharacterized protein n=1 Tax=Phlyctema vagabunda TaxID=108571 RepID=A0ABR4PMJ0_9HELO
MATTLWFSKKFKSEPKYSNIQEQLCPQCNSPEYHAYNKPQYDLKSLLFGYAGGTLVSLLFASFAFLWYAPRLQYGYNAGYYPADEVFGKVPTVEVIFQEDLTFVESDPLNGRWDGDLNMLNGERRTPWDELYLSPWVEIANPSAAGVSGGVPLKRFSNDPAWSTPSEGFVPSILHQLHCVGIIKHTLFRFEKGDFSDPSFEDTSHCLEYLRQTLMCHGDLTLEKPLFVTDKTFGGPTGWGTAHQCRDWSTIHSYISKHTIAFSDGMPMLWYSPN